MLTGRIVVSRTFGGNKFVHPLPGDSAACRNSPAVRPPDSLRLPNRTVPPGTLIKCEGSPQPPAAEHSDPAALLVRQAQSRHQRPRRTGQTTAMPGRATAHPRTPAPPVPVLWRPGWSPGYPSTPSHSRNAARNVSAELRWFAGGSKSIRSRRVVQGRTAQGGAGGAQFGSWEGGAGQRLESARLRSSMR